MGGRVVDASMWDDDDGDDDGDDVKGVEGAGIVSSRERLFDCIKHVNAFVKGDYLSIY